LTPFPVSPFICAPSPGEGWDGGKINKKMALELLLKTDTHNIYNTCSHSIISNIWLFNRIFSNSQWMQKKIGQIRKNRKTV